MAHYEIKRTQDRIIVISDADTTQISLTPLNGTEIDYFIRASDDTVWKRSGNDVTGYDYTELGSIGGGGGNVVDTLAATLGAGNTTGGTNLQVTDGDDVIMAGNSSSITFPADSGTFQASIGSNSNGLFIGYNGVPVMQMDNSGAGEFEFNYAVEARVGLAVGLGNTLDALIQMANADDSTIVTLGSPAAKAFLIDNTGHDVAAALNGAVETGVGLKVHGAAKVTGDLLTNSLKNNAGNLEITSTEKIILTGGTDKDLEIVVDGAGILKMNAAATYTGTIAGASGKSVVNGLIMD